MLSLGGNATGARHVKGIAHIFAKIIFIVSTKSVENEVVGLGLEVVRIRKNAIIIGYRF